MSLFMCCRRSRDKSQALPPVSFYSIKQAQPQPQFAERHYEETVNIRSGEADDDNAEIINKKHQIKDVRERWMRQKKDEGRGIVVEKSKQIQDVYVDFSDNSPDKHQSMNTCSLGDFEMRQSHDAHNSGQNKPIQFINDHMLHLPPELQKLRQKGTIHSVRQSAGKMSPIKKISTVQSTKAESSQFLTNLPSPSGVKKGKPRQKLSSFRMIHQRCASNSVRQSFNRVQTSVKNGGSTRGAAESVRESLIINESMRHSKGLMNKKIREKSNPHSKMTFGMMDFMSLQQQVSEIVRVQKSGCGSEIIEDKEVESLMKVKQQSDEDNLGLMGSPIRSMRAPLKLNDSFQNPNYANDVDPECQLDEEDITNQQPQSQRLTPKGEDSLVSIDSIANI